MSLPHINPSLATKRLQLRPLTASGAVGIAAILNDFEISKCLSPVPYPYAQLDAAEYIAGVGDKNAAV
jgi:hypothetical protein